MDYAGNGNFLYLLEAPEPSIDLRFTAYPPGPGKTRIKDEYVDFPDGRMLRKRLTRMVFLFGGRHNIAVGPCLKNSNQAVIIFFKLRSILP